jgi:hypothetical protein
MAADDVIQALIKLWDEVQGLLSPDARARLAGYIDDLAETRGSADLAETSGLIASLLYDELPIDHQVRTAWARPQTRGAGVKNWPSMTEQLIGVAQSVRLESQAWLLGTPAMPPDQVPGPDQRHLIRMVRPDGSVHVPSSSIQPVCRTAWWSTSTGYSTPTTTRGARQTGGSVPTPG